MNSSCTECGHERDESEVREELESGSSDSVTWICQECGSIVGREYDAEEL